MIREEAIEILESQKNEHNKEELNEALDMAISALKEPTWQEKLEKEYLFESIKEDMTKLEAENERLLKEVEALKGEWISHYDEDAKEGWYECSCCHSERAFNTNFCPDCGADMRGEVE